MTYLSTWLWRLWSRSFHVTSFRHGQPWQETWGNCPQLLETADQQALLSGRRLERGREVSASASGEHQAVLTQNTSPFFRPSTFLPRRIPCSLRVPSPARFSINYDLFWDVTLLGGFSHWWRNWTGQRHVHEVFKIGRQGLLRLFVPLNPSKCIYFHKGGYSQSSIASARVCGVWDQSCYWRNSPPCSGGNLKAINDIGDPPYFSLVWSALASLLHLVHLNNLVGHPRPRGS